MAKYADKSTHAKRASVMLERYLAGETAKQIGERFSLTGARVSQILSREFGVNFRNTGKRQRQKIRELREKHRADQKYLRKYAMTRDEYREINKNLDTKGVKPIRRYSLQKASARSRGIEFNLTFSQWWEIWRESGKWLQRGQRGFVMCRYNDVGAYEMGNVEIASASQNHREFINRYWSEIRSGERKLPYSAPENRT